MSVPLCWICGGDATTGEHSTKRSDLKSLFGTISQSTPLYRHDDTRRNKRVGSLDARVLKSPGLICEECNTNRTQPHDRAWEQMSEALRSWRPTIAPGVSIDPSRVFPKDTARQMLNVHLYFVKLFGCHIAGAGIPIDISGFANAIMQGTAHPHVYLKFGYAKPVEGLVAAGMTDIWLDPTPAGMPCQLAGWCYYVDFLNMHIFYGTNFKRPKRVQGVWHPRMASGKITIADHRRLDRISDELPRSPRSR